MSFQSIMVRIAALAIAMSVCTFVFVAHADDAPAADAGQAKITKSRSNIQNNRAAPAAEETDGATTTAAAEPAGVVKTKTKSNQSND
jgi:hypothetical protein